jgi:2-dehydro-3-deoxyphosphogluconate aldolase/(4S)-4-hydroxy-2-oxoglutarate aldolase
LSTDIEAALSSGCETLKFFPAEASGGLKYLNAISAPYKHTGMKFVPTGGVNASNLAAYLENSVVLACGGTWIAKKDDIANGNWEKIKSNCQEVANLVKDIG